MITLEEVLKWENEAKEFVKKNIVSNCGRIFKMIEAYKILSNKNKDLELENKVLREMIGKRGSVLIQGPLDEEVRQPGCIHGFKEPMLCEYCRDGVPF